MEEQNAKLFCVQTQVEEYLDKLCNDDLNLSSLEAHDDNEIIYMTNIIEEQKKHLINFKPEIEFEDVSIALQMRESAYDKLEGLLSSTCNLVLDNLRFEDDSEMKFEHILEKEKYWQCINCNKVSIGLLITYRKLEQRKSSVINVIPLDLQKCIKISYTIP